MTNPDPKELGKQIATLRKAQALSQHRLSQISGIPITAIRRCEQSGKIPLDRYLTLVSALKASLQIVQQSSPTTNPYKTIEDVIRSSSSRPAKKQPIGKPMLGGMFDRMTQT